MQLTFLKAVTNIIENLSKKVAKNGPLSYYAQPNPFRNNFL